MKADLHPLPVIRPQPLPKLSMVAGALRRHPHGSLAIRRRKSHVRRSP
jgi:hypothetical protein